ncbi:hypothetical protein AVEN_147382-1 [Araneus ventricosus]|uniref:Uncharacterized protein n=1 Tax=Araneus ventricosus TaxID=182803 RepID=A0A4Y2FS94_ARAVE|nr:hypothetical protein AVEN_147382-1 [Araneus ventricosus]
MSEQEVKRILEGFSRNLLRSSKSLFYILRGHNVYNELHFRKASSFLAGRDWSESNIFLLGTEADSLMVFRTLFCESSAVVHSEKFEENDIEGRD